MSDAPAGSRPPRGLSIRQTLWLATALTVASTVLGASALYRYHLHRALLGTQQAPVIALAESYAEMLSSLMAEGRRAEAESLVRTLAWHPASQLLAVIAADGQVLAARGDLGLLERAGLKALPPLKAGGFYAERVPARPDHGLPEADVAAVPLTGAGAAEPLGRLVYAVRPLPRQVPPPADIVRFFAGLAGIAACGLTMGFLLLKRMVADPLRRLTEDSRRAGAAGAANRLPTDRSDEIGQLARIVSGLHGDLDNWRGRVEDLERSLDDRVAAETRRLTLELKRARREIWTDPLTRLGNRRLLDEKFGDIFNAQKSMRQELAVVMVDLDNFKVLNDLRGHDAGDEILRFAGDLLRQGLRDQDLAIRCGGDEFVLILPGVTEEQARAVAARTVALFAQRTKALGLQPAPTMSAGIATLRGHQPPDAQSLLQMADQALYEAKRQGKGRVAVFSGRNAVAGRKP